jgi:hypothetical protein
VTAIVVQADARALPLPDESVDLVVTSFPYWSHRDYGHERQIGLEESYEAFLAELWTVTAECARVLKPQGSIFANLGDRYSHSGGYNNKSIAANGRGPRRYVKMGIRGRAQGPRAGEVRNLVCHQPAHITTDVPAQSRIGLPWRYALGVIDQLRLLLRAPIIWSKNCIPLNAVDRVEIKHEDVFHFAKESPCWSDPSVMGDWESVWRIPTEPTTLPCWWSLEHKPAPFPSELVRRIILGWCPPGGVVLDPMCGTGTVPMVARALDRVGIGVDLNHDYARLARWHCFESGRISKAIRRTNEEAQATLL